jgi:glucose/arabinose dehydrogenase
MSFMKAKSRLALVICSALAAVAVSCSLLFLSLREAPSGQEIVGPTPTLPQAYRGWVPTHNFSKARPWPENTSPKAPSGFSVSQYASGLEHPRWLYMLPNGDALVAESSSIERTPESIRYRIQGWFQRRAGAVGPSANRITLLRDANRDGIADYRNTFLSGLNQPFGMALLGDILYVANTDGVWQYPYHEGETSIESKGRKILDLPAGGYNNHWTRNIVVNPSGTKLYISVGSGSNAGENGIENEFHRASILEANLDGSGLRVFAWGLRNPTGMAWPPHSNTLWTVVNERDLLGNDLPPDYLTSVKDGAFYGWPYSYWGQRVDSRVSPQRPDLVATAIAPDYSLGAHVAPLGLTFYSANQFPNRYYNGAFVGEHGSWNRRPFAGYKVVFIPFRNGHPDGTPEDFLTGFMSADEPGVAYGRPVGVAIDRTGALLVADDVGNAIWRVAATK